MKLEAKLKTLGASATLPAQFWMSFETFLKCYSRVNICNLMPDKKITVPVTDKEVGYFIIFKTRIFISFLMLKFVFFQCLFFR